MERMGRNIKCPFLAAGRCSIYAARPQTCRNYHATSAVGCQQSYEDPQNLDIDPEFAPGVYQSGGAHVDAFTSAMRDAGYDTNVYELNCALDAALSDPGARERFQSKSPPFIHLSGDDVPAVFDDLD
jgi:Fe-S-cluster containining protein